MKNGPQLLLSSNHPVCRQLITFDLVSTITEIEVEDIVDGTVGIQQVGVAMVTNKAMGPTKN